MTVTFAGMTHDFRNATDALGAHAQRVHPGRLRGAVPQLVRSERRPDRRGATRRLEPSAVRAPCEHVFVRWDALAEPDRRQPRLPGSADPVVRTFDAPEALDIRFHEVQAKSALNRVPDALADAVPLDHQPVQRLHSCVHFLFRSSDAHLPRPERRPRLRARDRRQGQPARGAAGRAGAPVMGARARGARDQHRPLPVGREALRPDARGLAGDAAVRHAVVRAHQVAAAAARRRRDARARRRAGVPGQPVDSHARREGLARDRAAHAEPACADRGGQRRSRKRASPPGS